MAGSIGTNNNLRGRREASMTTRMMMKMTTTMMSLARSCYRFEKKTMVFFVPTLNCWVDDAKSAVIVNVPSAPRRCSADGR